MIIVIQVSKSNSIVVKLTQKISHFQLKLEEFPQSEATEQNIIKLPTSKHRQKRQYVPGTSTTTTATTTTATTITTATTTTQPWWYPVPPVVLIGTAAVGSVILTPDLPLVTPQLIPPGNNIVGCPWGGGLPQGRSPITQLSGLLVPEGKIPVSVFPPFHSSRTRKAVCVIFAEDENIGNVNSEVTRFKRSIAKHLLRRRQRSPTYLKRQMNNFFGETSSNLKNIMQCLKAQITRLLKQKKLHKKYQPQKFQKYKYDDEINSFDDCFDDLGEPRYGYICRVRLVEDQPCVLGVTCRGVPDDEDDLLVDLFEPAFDLLTDQDFSERQTGKAFAILKFWIVFQITLRQRQTDNINYMITIGK